MAVSRSMKNVLSFGVASVGGAYDAFVLTITNTGITLEKGGRQPLKMGETPPQIRRLIREYREVLDEIEEGVNEHFPLPPDVIDAEVGIALPGVTTVTPSAYPAHPVGVIESS